MSVDRPRVLVLSDAGSFHTERYVQQLRKQGCQVLLASLERGDTLGYHQIKRRGLFLQFHYVMAATEIRAIIRRYQPDVVNAHFASGYGFTAAMANAARSAPLLISAWGSDILVVPEKSVLHRRKTAYAINAADALTADSAYLVEMAREFSSPRKVLIVPWGIERAYLAFHKTSYRLSKPLRILVPRPHEKVYNNPFLVRALAPMIRAGLIEITFPSWGNQLGDFKLLARSLVGDRVRYYEADSREQYLERMSTYDVYLSSATSDSSPVSLIEAMALGLIPVVADIPGVREWATPETAFLYPLYDPAAVSRQIESILEGDGRPEMRRNNLAIVKERAIFEDNIAKVIDLMRTLMQSRQS